MCDGIMNPKKTKFTPTAMVVVRMWYLQESESQLAVQMVDAATVDGVKRFVWLPVSQLYKVKKHEKENGEDFVRLDMTVPVWLSEQKGLKQFELDTHSTT